MKIKIVDVLITITILGISIILLVILILAGITRLYWSIPGFTILILTIITLITSVKVIRIYGGLVGRAALYLSMAISTLLAFGLLVGPLEELFGKLEIYEVVVSIIYVLIALFLLLVARTLLKVIKKEKI